MQARRSRHRACCRVRDSTTAHAREEHAERRDPVRLRELEQRRRGLDRQLERDLVAIERQPRRPIEDRSAARAGSAARRTVRATTRARRRVARGPASLASHARVVGERRRRRRERRRRRTALRDLRAATAPTGRRRRCDGRRARARRRRSVSHERDADRAARCAKSNGWTKRSSVDAQVRVFDRRAARPRASRPRGSAAAARRPRRTNSTRNACGARRALERAREPIEIDGRRASCHANGML